MSQGKLWVGTSGWSYQHWRNGVFYPARLAARKWLPYFAEQFSTVEVNATFYSLQRETSTQTWHDATPEDFVFAVKMWRAVTHYHGLVDTEELLDRFFASIKPLGKKLGPVLIQLPARLAPDVAALDNFLSLLKRKAHLPIAVEFRSKAWYNDAVKSALKAHNAALVVHDMKGSVNNDAGGADFVYARFHGPGNWGRYSDEQLESHALQIKGWLDAGKNVYGYFNNDAQGYAIENATALVQLVSPHAKHVSSVQ